MLDKKLLLISHIADPDGITPIVLASLVYKTIETKLLEPREVDENVENLLERINDYDEIHIVDLNISERLAEIINKDEKIKSKIKIFDHHISGITLNKYDFITVIDEENGRKESGTSIYYEFLKTVSDNPLLLKNSTKGLVNQVRTIDTYDFNEIPKEEAHNIDCLFGMFGREEYVNYFKKYIDENDEFEYTEKEKFLINLEQSRINRYIESKAKEMIRVKIEGHVAGLVFAERYRSDLGNYLVDNNEDVDFAILINIARSISYRANGKFDLSVFTKKLGGGGHKNAAGSPLPENILKDIVKKVFKDIEFVEEKNEGNEERVS